MEDVIDGIKSLALSIPKIRSGISITSLPRLLLHLRPPSRPGRRGCAPSRHHQHPPAPPATPHASTSATSNSPSLHQRRPHQCCQLPAPISRAPSDTGAAVSGCPHDPAPAPPHTIHPFDALQPIHHHYHEPLAAPHATNLNLFFQILLLFFQILLLFIIGTARSSLLSNLHLLTPTLLLLLSFSPCRPTAAPLLSQ